ncbi:MAG: HEAT repeat domain-containing protein [Gemmataceae bacterium]
MRWHHSFFVLLIWATALEPASAGIIFNRQNNQQGSSNGPKIFRLFKGKNNEPPPNQHHQPTNSMYPHQPAPAVQPNGMDGMVQTLQHSPDAEQRYHAAVQLGKMRPFPPAVSAVLQQAANNDSSMKVRVAAKTALMQQQINGFINDKMQQVPRVNPPTMPRQPTTQEPPLAEPLPAPPASPAPPPRLVPQPAPAVPPSWRGPTTTEPPLAPPAPSSSNYAPRGPVVPTQPPMLRTPPPNWEPMDGPQLIVPK